MDRTARTDAATDPPDDAALAQMVKDVAAGWTLPPRRLDEVPWPERVRQPRWGRRSAGIGVGGAWTRRLVGATALALAATVALSGLAVWLTGPRRDPGLVAGVPTAAPGTSASGSLLPRPSATTTPSNGPLPKLVRFGDLPSVTRVLVVNGGTHRLVDLTTGDSSPALFPRHDTEYAVLPRPAGGWVCICGDYRTGTGADPTNLILTLEPVDAAGVRGQPVKARTVKGVLDPEAAPGEQPQAVDVKVTASPDGGVAFIGWSYRGATRGWVAGVDVVDLSTLTTVSTIALPSTEPGPTSGRVWSRIAPAVAVSPVGRTLLMSSDWYVSTTSASVPSGTDHWSAAWDGRAPGALAGAGSSTSDTCGENRAGFVDATTIFTVCWWDSTPAIERHRLDGGLIDRVDLPAAMRSTEPSAALLTVAPDAVYTWQTRDRTIARYDLKAGTVLQAQAPEPVAVAPDDGLLARLGRQLGNAIAPPVAAKVFLQPGLLVSQDGSRVYALGTVTRDGAPGSQGVFVFDARSLQPLGNWAPTADLMSIAISPDGGSLYAAGMAGVDVAGVQRWTESGYASITVFDTADGSIRLIAGEVAPSDVWFPDSSVGPAAGANR